MSIAAANIGESGEPKFETAFFVCIFALSRNGFRLSIWHFKVGREARGIPGSLSFPFALLAAVAGVAASPAVASAGAQEEILGAASYPGMTT